MASVLRHLARRLCLRLRLAIVQLLAPLASDLPRELRPERVVPEASAHLDTSCTDHEELRSVSFVVARVLFAQPFSPLRLLLFWLHQCRISLLANFCRRGLRF